MGRLKDWIKRHIVDDAPENDESHSATRYAQPWDCVHCAESNGRGGPGNSCCVQCLEERRHDGRHEGDE